MKDFLNKEKVKKIIDWCMKHKRFFIAGALFIVLVVILFACTGPNAKREANEPETQLPSTEEQTEQSDVVSFELDTDFEKDAHEEINNLISTYFKAFAEADIDTLEMIATPISENEKSYIRVFSEYIESYENIACYTKAGLTTNSYLVSVYFDLKFAGVKTMAPGLDFFYVETKEDGSVYINNLYSPYNLSRTENDLDPNVYAIILKFEQQEDSAALRATVEQAYTEAVASDVDLATMLSTTIPNAMTVWMEGITSGGQETEDTEMETETDTTDETTDNTTEAEETQQEESPNEQTPEETTPDADNEQPENTMQQNTPVKVKVTSNSVNIRKKASRSADAIAGAKKGDIFTKLGEEDDWTKVDYEGKTGYIKTEYLTEVTE